MPDWDLKSDEGLRAACAEAENAVEPHRLARVTKFLEEVARFPTEDRSSIEFQRKIWRENPVVEMPDRLGRKIEDPGFAQWFAAEIRADLPEGPQKRTEALAKLDWRIVNRKPIFDRDGDTNWRESMQARRALAAVFPEHFAGTCHARWIRRLAEAMGGTSYGDEPADDSKHWRRRILENLWIRRRLDEVLGAANSMEDHAKRLLVSGELSDWVSREPHVWMVRSGKKGEFEEDALRHNLAILGWSDTGNLADCDSRDAIRERLHRTYPDSSAQKVGAWLSSLAPFRLDLRLRDWVLMPRKHDPKGMVAAGRVTGRYVFRAIGDRTLHTRAVSWYREEVPRERFDETFAKALNDGHTVVKVKTKDAAAAIEKILRDPEPTPVLAPLPAARRQKSIPSSFDDVLNLVAFVKDRCPYEDVLQQIRAEEPNLKENSVAARFYRAAIPLNVMRKVGDQVELTGSGKELLASRGPDAVRDHLLTAVFGPDHALVKLDAEPLPQSDFLAFLRSLNHRWKTTGAPQGWIRCLGSLDVLVRRHDGAYVLTERGRRWRSAIHWTPEPFRPEEPASPIVGPEDIEVFVPSAEDFVGRVQEAAGKRDLTFDRKLIETLHHGLWAHERRHFAILAGLSGSGKTQLAWEYARVLTGANDESDIRFCAVSAAPGWHDPTALLGYVNPLDGSYVGTDFQRFLVHAAENPKAIHACVLDEMNLSHPEQYLAPLLSAMERRGGMIELHDGDEEDFVIPNRIPYPSNLVLIGTVNMDETTMGISDKVLDRAFTLEFWDIKVDAWPGWSEAGLAPEDEARARSLLNELMKVLRPARLHFGWRVIAEFVAFLERRRADSAISFDEALDQVTYAKVLPKLRGDDAPRFRDALEACKKVLSDAQLEKSAQKVEELTEDLNETGSFRFWR